MILKGLKSNRAINQLIFPVIGILCWLQSLLEPFTYPFFIGENNNILFIPLYKITRDFDFVNVIISLVFVIGIGFIVQAINNRFSFIHIRTKLPAVIFVIIVGGFTSLHTFHPVFIAAVFLLLAIYNLFSTFEKVKPYSNIFNSGFLIGVGTLFYFNLIVLFPAFFIGITILSREHSWRGFIILLTGFFVPVFWAFSYAIVTEQTLELLKTFEENIITPVNYFRSNIALHGLLSFLIFLTIVGSIKILQQYDSKKVSTRKYFTIFFILFILSILGFTFVPAISLEMLILAAIPVTYLVSNYFVFLQSRFWGELLFIILIGLTVIMQFSDKFMLNG